MGLQKFRADVKEDQADGSVVWRTRWIGGPSLVMIVNCRIVTLAGDARANVFVQDDADTWFSIPAKFYFFGKVLNGYITSDEDGQLVCHHCYY